MTNKIDTASRYRRLLLLIPFVLRNPGVSVDEVCERFGMTRKQLIDDLNLLFMCGLPGYGPGDLIDASVDGEQVVIRTADYFSQPLRITPAEGLLLYTAAKAMQAAGAGDDAKLNRAIQALEVALGAEGLDRVSVRVGEHDHVQELRSAIDARVRVNIVYLSQSKGEQTQRDVDPWGLVLVSGRWYLVGYCHLVDDERTFLVDRIKALEVLDVPAEVPDDFKASEHSDLYMAGEESFRLVMELSPRAAWVTDHYKVSAATKLQDGWSRVELDASGPHRFVKLLLGLGEDVRLISPQDLKDQMNETACRMLSRYSR